ncbi:hypothetical protein A2U01_0019407 [Trifolium medium]|uniref:Uncharacterized protein n=1 Tax=Trifolium medium TaxID=97028 RepID=A0A392NH09_9FABA|nr:hypothetical protein [Trifolium medium]
MEKMISHLRNGSILQCFVLHCQTVGGIIATNRQAEPRGCQTVGGELRQTGEQSHTVARWQDDVVMWGHGRSGETSCGGCALRTRHFAAIEHGSAPPCDKALWHCCTQW